MSGKAIFAGGRSSISSLFRFNVESEYDLLFRLNAPVEENNEWSIDFFLQSKKDPSLLFLVQDVWLNAQMRIAAAKKLGEAARISKFASYEKRPVSLKISSADVLEFLKSDASALRSSGFQVQIPKNLELQVKPKLDVRLSMKNKLITKGELSASDLLSFDYAVTLGDNAVDFKLLNSIAVQKLQLVRVKNKWVEVNPADIEKLLGLISKQTPTSVADVFPTVFKAVEEGVETFFSGNYKFDSFSNALCNYEFMQDVELPSSFKGSLRPYQKIGVAWLDFHSRLGFGALLADDMGLGKTIQVIAHVLRRVENGAKSILVICPTSVIGNWLCEFNRFAPSLKVKVHHGIERTSGSVFASEVKEADVVITSYALLWRDEVEIKSINWEVVIADEAQNIKNPVSKQSLKIRALHAKERIALSGTPVENRLSDLWAIMNFLNPGYLYSWDTFKDVFAKPIEVSLNEEKKNALKVAVSPFILRRVKTDKSIISDLPDKVECVEWCNLTLEQVTLYKAVVDASLEKLNSVGENDRQFLIFSTITKLKQICNHPANFLKDSQKLGNRSGKVERLRELLNALLLNYESTLVFSQYTEMTSLLFENLKLEFPNVPIFYLHGKLSRKQRERVINDFQNEKQPAIMLLSLKAGGTGLNLTKATNVIHFDRWWNPAVENQASDRAFRIGQKKNVFVYKLTTSGSIEEKIEEMIQRKLQLANSVIQSGQSEVSGLTKLSTTELRKVFELRDDLANVS